MTSKIFTKKLSSIDQKIADLQKDIDHLQSERQKLEGLSLIQRITEILHQHVCHSNHTDGCDWYYGSWEKPSYAHTKYTAKAIIILKLVEPLDMETEQLEDFIANFLAVI